MKRRLFLEKGSKMAGAFLLWIAAPLDASKRRAEKPAGTPVMLNSGGPPMVIEGYRKVVVEARGPVLNANDLVLCSWETPSGTKSEWMPLACVTAWRES